MDTKVLLIGGAAVLGYLWWKNQAQPTVAAAPAGTSAPSPNAPAVPVVQTSQSSGATPAAAYPNTLAAITAVINASGVSTTYIYSQQSPDVWNYYAAQAIPNFTPPAAEQLYPGTSNAHAPVTFQSWWSKIQPFLPSGLSGANIPRVASQMGNQMGWLQ